MFSHVFFLVTSAEKLTEDPNTSAPSMPPESVSESLAPTVFFIIWSFSTTINPRGTFNSFVFVLCITVQVKMEDVDLQSAAPVSVNLIDFTDLTPVVSMQMSCDTYPKQVLFCPHLQVLNLYSPLHLRVDALLDHPSTL